MTENLIGNSTLPAFDKLRRYDAVCVLGPTACGKTSFAVALALAMGNAEILSADSRQVYRRMDIGTGKDLCEYGTVPYHLIDIVEAGTKYNLFEYQKDFSKAYQDIRSRGGFPIICGGSGLYIEAVTKPGYNLKAVEPDAALRASLEEKSFDELLEQFKALKLKHGSQPHNHTDYDTKKRLIRALEIELAIDSANQNFQSPKTQNTVSYKTIGDVEGQAHSTTTNLVLPRKVYFNGLEISPERRRAKIDRRLEARLNEGMIDEVRKLLDSGIKAEDLVYYGLEYKFVTQYLTGEISYEWMKEHLAIAIHQFAKRQMTWFRGMERRGATIHWIPAE